MQKVLPELYEGHAPITLQNAFHDALEALEEWEEGNEEPVVAVEGRGVPISRIFAHMSACGDLLPLRTRDVLESFVDKGSFRASGGSLYADGAKLVMPLCVERLTLSLLRPTSSAIPPRKAGVEA
ncbi:MULTISPECIES: hypothetical protein [unclassified Sinorhizobium]|uniref:hypothetical protein n=1 Tax=unclassified Sinorhizobium TaxID=2613772 RepID=UPI0024C26BF2|nr:MULTISPECIES: hypothetical protein [unclassified Sinorhizobium]MDK1374042.1 hypothetical protein [Sinorhizobium sp. 6-70]MDK1480693.1 hypothetical protein [Sinorhizobium sp. 6-117]